MSDLTDEQIADIWRRRKERALRWRRESGELAPAYPAVSLEEETEETLNAMPSPELDSEKRRRARERESQ
jgi:hypothetical protein